MKGLFIIFCLFFTSCSLNSLTLNEYLASVGEESEMSSDLNYISIDAVAINGFVYQSEDGSVKFESIASRTFQNQNTIATYTYVKPRYSEGVGKDYIYSRNGKYYGLRIYTPVNIGFTLVPQDTITTIPWATADPEQIVVLYKE